MLRLPAVLLQLKDRMQGKLPGGLKRSSKWPRIRAIFLRINPACAACGGKKKVEVHHKKPFHLAPELELEFTNLITLCEAKKWGINCHLAIGHRGNYRQENTEVDSDSKFWSKRLKGIE